VSEGRGREPEADDEADDHLHRGDEPADKVGGDHGLDHLSIGRETIEELTNAHSIEEGNVLAKHVAQHQGAQAARAARGRDGVQHAGEQRQQRIGDIDGKQDKSDPVELVLTHAQVRETHDINKPAHEKVLRHVEECADGGEESRRDHKRQLRLAELEQTQRRDLLGRLVVGAMLQSPSSSPFVSVSAHASLPAHCFRTSIASRATTHRMRTPTKLAAATNT
jgi:hypothetical protein